MDYIILFIFGLVLSVIIGVMFPETRLEQTVIEDIIKGPKKK